MLELVDNPDLGSGAFERAGSSPAGGTNKLYFYERYDCMLIYFNNSRSGMCGSF